MSRILVKNLHSGGIDELKKLLAKHGQVTDFNFKCKTDKSQLGYAFIGFKEEESAKNAMENLNKRLLMNQKLHVEAATEIFDASRPKSSTNKAYREKLYTDKVSKAENYFDNCKSKEEYLLEMIQDVANDPDFLKYLRVKSKPDAIPYKKRLDFLKKEAKKNSEGVQISRKERIESLSKRYIKSDQVANGEIKFMIKLKAPRNVTKKEIIQFFKPLKLKNVDLPWHGKQINPGFTDVEFFDENDQKEALKRNNGYLMSKKMTLTEYKIEPKKKIESKKNHPVQSSEFKSNEIFDNGQIFFRNLSYSCTESEIRELLEKFGPLSDLKFQTVDQNDGTSINKGFGSCIYTFPEHALKAYNELDGSSFQGRIIHLLPGKQRGVDNLDADDSLIQPRTKDSENKDFKDLKQQNLKKHAQKSYNWNTFFFTSDAISTILSKKYKVTKEEILNPKKSGISVTLALGEAEIVNETKKFLEEHGIYLDSFASENYLRSDKIILMKNLPVEFTKDDIENTFSIESDRCEIIRPNNSSSCLLKFNNKIAAQKFFEKYSYYKLKSGAIFLEWAPTDIFKAPKQVQISLNKMESVQNNSLLVKNLPFGVSESEILEAFKNYRPEKVNMVSDKKSGKLFSICSIDFKNGMDCEKALKEMQNFVLNGSELKLSQTKPKISKAVQKKSIASTKDRYFRNDEENKTKIIVKNLPFQANMHEIKQLFESFGQIDYVRVPPKSHNFSNYSNHSHRGFAFVNFVLAHEAKKAFDVLSLSTHLYGRRLILQWADDEAESGIDIGSARKRAKLSGSMAPTHKEVQFGLEKDLEL